MRKGFPNHIDCHDLDRRMAIETNKTLTI
jgi:hypothetical protein